MSRLNRFNSKHAQITVMIIIGLVILIAAGFTMYIFMQKAEEGHITEEVVMFEYEGQREIHNYIMACLKPAVIEGLEIMRLQGGYIYVPDDVEVVIVKDSRDRVVKLDNGSLKVFVDPDATGNKVPYWLGIDYVNIPSKQFLENELRFYVESETYKCIADFENFRQIGYEIDSGDLNVDINLENAVIVDMNLPLEVKKGEVMFELKDYTYVVPVDWDKILNAGTDIVLYEIINSYLEDFTVQMISVYSGPDEQMLPPMAATIPGMTCSDLSWNIDDAHAKLMAIVHKNMPNIRINSTNYTKVESYNSATQNYYDSLVHNILENDMSLHISHEYRILWGMNFDIKPKQGDTIKGDVTRIKGMGLIPPFCSVKYNFKYSVEYPALVSIKHDYSADLDPFINFFAENQGYEFSLPMKVIIYGNQKREYVPKSPLLGLAEDEAEKILEEINFSSAQFLFCEPEQRLSHNITVVVKDIFTDENIEKVDIYYNFPYSSSLCHIGTTGADGKSTAEYPLCNNCQITLSKTDHDDKKYIMSSSDKLKSSYSFYIESLKELNLEVKQIYLPDFMRYYYETDGFINKRLCTNESPIPLFNSTIRDIEPAESVVITSNDLPGNIITYPLMDTIMLSSGDYRLSAVVVGDSTIEPSVYELDDGRHQTISLHPSGNGTYYGPYPISTSEYNLHLDYVINNSNITLFVLVDYLPSEIIDVKKATTSIIGINNTLGYQYLLDHDCNATTPNKSVNVKILQEDYEWLLQPIVT